MKADKVSVCSVEVKDNTCTHSIDKVCLSEQSSYCICCLLILISFNIKTVTITITEVLEELYRMKSVGLSESESESEPALLPSRFAH